MDTVKRQVTLQSLLYPSIMFLDVEEYTIASKGRFKLVFSKKPVVWEYTEYSEAYSPDNVLIKRVSLAFNHEGLMYYLQPNDDLPQDPDWPATINAQYGGYLLTLFAYPEKTGTIFSINAGEPGNDQLSHTLKGSSENINIPVFGHGENLFRIVDYNI
ncbi:hypothetical protein [Serratia sp. BIGb0163]|uniref:hypothetical protein n=1 Tax=Serratia sp. BIGb0163 TaxID=2940613 RepID=UPI0021683F35|nr:hypothetical protein [Serratia sp. BIGb0163]MCS4266614.1 hypothetical protein [Serratia sp. BIGb0163]